MILQTAFRRTSLTAFVRDTLISGDTQAASVTDHQRRLRPPAAMSAAAPVDCLSPPHSSIHSNFYVGGCAGICDGYQALNVYKRNSGGCMYGTDYARPDSLDLFKFYRNSVVEAFIGVGIIRYCGHSQYIYIPMYTLHVPIINIRLSI